LAFTVQSNRYEQESSGIVRSDAKHQLLRGGGEHESRLHSNGSYQQYFHSGPQSPSQNPLSAV
jgi:hypothetical protein